MRRFLSVLTFFVSINAFSQVTNTMTATKDLDLSENFSGFTGFAMTFSSGDPYRWRDLTIEQLDQPFCDVMESSYWSTKKIVVGERFQLSSLVVVENDRDKVVPGVSEQLQPWHTSLLYEKTSTGMIEKRFSDYTIYGVSMSSNEQNRTSFSIGVSIPKNKPMAISDAIRDCFGDYFSFQ